MVHGGGVFPLRTAVGSGSGLYKLVKLGNNGAMRAATNVEVARIEASFMGPELHDSDNELLQISGNEEEERKALLERMQTYDMMLSRIETQEEEEPPSMMTGSDVYTATTMGDAKLTIDFDAQVRALAHSLNPVAPRHLLPPPLLFPHTRTRSKHHYCTSICELEPSWTGNRKQKKKKKKTLCPSTYPTQC